MAYRLTSHAYNYKWIVEAPEEMGPANGIPGGHPPVAPEKLVSPQPTRTQTNIKMLGSH